MGFNVGGCHGGGRQSLKHCGRGQDSLSQPKLAFNGPTGTALDAQVIVSRPWSSGLGPIKTLITARKYLSIEWIKNSEWVQGFPRPQGEDVVFVAEYFIIHALHCDIPSGPHDAMVDVDKIQENGC